MSAVREMYSLGPVYDLNAKVDLPTSMYSLPVIQSSAGENIQVTKPNIMNFELVELSFWNIAFSHANGKFIYIDSVANKVRISGPGSGSFCHKRSGFYQTCHI